MTTPTKPNGATRPRLTEAQRTFKKWCRGPKNARRHALIVKKFGPGLSVEEEAELETLQTQVGELADASQRDSMAPWFRDLLDGMASQKGGE